MRVVDWLFARAFSTFELIGFVILITLPNSVPWWAWLGAFLLIEVAQYYLAKWLKVEA